MKFTPREPAENVNVSSTHPLAELAWLAGGLALVVTALYLGLWLLTELVVPRVPVNMEVWAAKRLMVEQRPLENPELSRILRGLLETLPARSPLRRYDFSIEVIENDTVNAMALPGGRIVVFSGLLKKVRSENELAMVLGHELGHYAHRDHLRGLGRGVGAALATAMIFGQDSHAAGIASKLFLGMEMRYSQRQESAADSFGLDMLASRYGHAGGAVDFFSRLKGESGGKISYILASHPHPDDRISSLRRMIAAKGYRVERTIPMKEGLKVSMRKDSNGGCPGK